MVKTVILCGGRGTRLKPLTDRVPKTLIPLNGTPLLHHLVMFYLKSGFNRFVLCTGYRGDMIKEFIDRSKFSAEFEFSNSGEDAGMLRRLYDARNLFSEQVFVAYGDTLVNVDLQALLSAHRSSGAMVTLTTANVRSPFGLVTYDRELWVSRFEEKPLQTYFVGQMVLERSVLDQIDPELVGLSDGAGLIELFGRLIKRRALRTHPYEGPQITFNTHEQLAEAERDFIEFFSQQEDE